MIRERLPNRRSALTFEFAHAYPGSDLHVYAATIGFYPDGRPAEVFVDRVNVDAHDASILISFALQHGANLSDMGAAMLRAEDGAAHGLFGALIDAASKALA